MKIPAFILPVLVLALASCSHRQIEFEKGSGQVNHVKKGEKFRISLPEDHSTKYLWTLKKDIPTTRVDYMGSVFHGTYVDFNFTAVGPGREELELYLYCSKDTAARKTYIVEVE